MDYTKVLARIPSYSTDLPYRKGTAAEYLAVAKGPRMLAWFTSHGKKNICFLVTPNSKTIVPVAAAFASSLALGTLLAGVVVHKTFIVDDIFHLKGSAVRSVQALRQVMDDLGQTRLLPKQVIFQLAPISPDPFIALPYQHALKSLDPPALYPPIETQVHTITAVSKDVFTADVEILVDTLERSRFLSDLFHTCRTIPMVCMLHPVHKKWVPITS